MTEYATPANTTNPVLDPRTYWLVSAYALAAVAALGIVMNAVGQGALLGSFLSFDWTHNVLHVALAAAAFVFAYAPLHGRTVRAGAIVFGIVYAGLGVVGFFAPAIGPLHLEIGENIIHLVLGAWALASGFAARY